MEGGDAHGDDPHLTLTIAVDDELEVLHLLLVLGLAGLRHRSSGRQYPLQGVEVVRIGVLQHFGLGDLNVVVSSQGHLDQTPIQVRFCNSNLYLLSYVHIYCTYLHLSSM